MITSPAVTASAALETTAEINPVAVKILPVISQEIILPETNLAVVKTFPEVEINSVEIQHTFYIVLFFST